VVDVIQLSWSKAQKLGQCARAFDFAYVEKIRPLVQYDAGVSALRGTLFHWAMKNYLAELLNGQTDLTQAQVEAVYAMERHADTLRESSTAEMYHEDIAEALAGAKKMWQYYIPRSGIGTRYFPTRWGKEPAIEMDFEVALMRGMTFRGTVDAIMYDKEMGENVLVDWKTVTQMPRDSSALVDGQLHAYAAALNKHGTKGKIRRVIRWHFRASTPAEPEISVKDKQPLTGRASYNTTWGYWSAAVEAMGIDTEKYREVMEPKMKGHNAFEYLVESIVTPTSDLTAWDDLQAKGQAVKDATKRANSGKMGAAALSSRVCEFCPYKVLCAGPLRYGDPLEPVLVEFFHRDGVPFEYEAEDESLLS